MRNVLLTLLLSGIMTAAFADNQNEICSSDPMRETIANMISHETPFTEFDLEGIVSIQFMVDDQHVIHVKGISGGNTFLINHVLTSLQNKVLHCDCVNAGTLYTLKLQYVQYS